MLLIIAPDANSVAYLLSQVTINQTVVIGNVTLYTVTYKANQFMIVVSGYGKINVARAITIATERATITGILCIGTIGHLDICRPKIFSAIISSDSFQYDVNFTALGEPIGTLPNMDEGVFDADSTMIANAKLAAMEHDVRYHVGTIATADRFVSDSCLAYCLRRIFKASGVDSDTGAVGQVAHLNNIPYVAIKVISNNASCDAGIQHEEYEDEALLICQKIALSYIEADQT